MRGTYVNRSNKKNPATQQPPTRVQTRLEIINIAIIQVQRTGLISVVLFAPQRSSFSECTAHRIRINKRMTKEINYRCVCGSHYGNYGENKEKPSVLVLPKPDRLPRTCTDRNYWTLLLWRMPSRNDRKKHCGTVFMRRHITRKMGINHWLFHNRNRIKARQQRVLFARSHFPISYETKSNVFFHT